MSKEKQKSRKLGKDFPIPPPPLFGRPTMSRLGDEITASPPTVTAPLILSRSPVIPAATATAPAPAPQAPPAASTVNQSGDSSPSPPPAPSTSPVSDASGSLLSLSQTRRLSPPNRDSLRPPEPSVSPKSSNPVASASLLSLSQHRRLSPYPASASASTSSSRRPSAQNSPSTSRKHSSDHSTASFDARHTAAQPLPPILGSFASASFSQSFAANFNHANHRDMPDSFWDEPESNADAYDDRLYSFSPVIDNTRTRTMSVDTIAHSNVHETNDMVELDLESFARSEHGSVRSCHTRGTRGSKDGLMREVQNSLVTSREMKFRKYALWCATLLLVSLTVGLSLGLTAGRSSAGEPSPATLLPHATHGKDAPIHSTTTTLLAPNHCDFSIKPHPDPFVQCDCLGRIFSYPDAVKSTYEHLKQTWLPNVVPTFQEQADSCHPQNLALAWLSMDAQRPELTQDNYTNRFVMAVVYASLKGSTWKSNANWLSTTGVCDWFGVSCDAMKRFTSLKLHQNNMAGSLPSELGLIHTLGYLDLSYNHIIGSIPNELGSIRHLMELRLSVNFLQGSIPSTIGNLGQLRTFQVDFNLITGSIPTTFSNLLFLKQLNLWDNKIVGTLHSNMKNMVDLEEMRFHNNKITGTIPTDIGTLTKLKVFDAAGNRLHGTLPTQLGFILPLENLDLGGTGVEGAVPTELANCTNLSTLGLSNNLLNGTIPTQLGGLKKLKFLFLGGNKLVGTIPPDLGKLTLLEILQLETNRLEGTVPTDLGKLSALKTLNLSDNAHLKAQIAEPICGLRTAGNMTTFIASCDTCKVPTCCTQCA